MIKLFNKHWHSIRNLEWMYRTKVVMDKLSFWPETNPINFCFTMKVVLNIILLVLPSINSIRNQKDIVNALMPLYELSNIILLSLNSLILFASAPELKRFLQLMGDFWSREIPVEHEKWLLKRTKLVVLANRITFLMWYMYLSAAYIYSVYPMVSLFIHIISPTGSSENYSEIIVLDYGIDVKSNVYVFLIYQCFVMYLAYQIAAHIALFDTITFNWIFSMAFTFDYVLFRLKHLNARMAALDEVQIKREIREVIAEHVSAIDLMKKLNAVTNPLILVEFLLQVVVIVISILMFSVLDIRHHGPKIIATSSGSYVRLFMYCYFSQMMRDQNLLIAQEAAALEWYNESISIQKSLILIIRQGQENIGLSAGRFFIITMETFTSVVKSSYSLLTFLRSMF